MRYKVTKSFFDPFARRRIFLGETVKVADEHLGSYKPYIEIPVEPKEPSESAPPQTTVRVRKQR